MASLTASATAPRKDPAAESPPSSQYPENSGEETLIAKRDVQLLVEKTALSTLLAKQIHLPFHSQEIEIVTSLDADLQAYLLKSMDRKNSRYIGIVAMEAKTGRVLALAGFNKIHPDINPCLVSTYPGRQHF